MTRKHPNILPKKQQQKIDNTLNITHQIKKKKKKLMRWIEMRWRHRGGLGLLGDADEVDWGC